MSRNKPPYYLKELLQRLPRKMAWGLIIFLLVSFEIHSASPPGSFVTPDILILGTTYLLFVFPLFFRLIPKKEITLFFRLVRKKVFPLFHWLTRKTEQSKTTLTLPLFPSPGPSPSPPPFNPNPIVRYLIPAVAVAVSCLVVWQIVEFAEAVHYTHLAREAIKRQQLAKATEPQRIAELHANRLFYAPTVLQQVKISYATALSSTEQSGDPLTDQENLDNAENLLLPLRDQVRGLLRAELELAIGNLYRTRAEVDPTNKLLLLFKQSTEALQRALGIAQSNNSFRAHSLAIEIEAQTMYLDYVISNRTVNSHWNEFVTDGLELCSKIEGDPSTKDTAEHDQAIRFRALFFWIRGERLKDPEGREALNDVMMRKPTGKALLDASSHGGPLVAANLINHFALAQMALGRHGGRYAAPIVKDIPSGVADIQAAISDFEHIIAIRAKENDRLSLANTHLSIGRAYIYLAERMRFGHLDSKANDFLKIANTNFDQALEGFTSSGHPQDHAEIRLYQSEALANQAELNDGEERKVATSQGVMYAEEAREAFLPLHGINYALATLNLARLKAANKDFDAAKQLATDAEVLFTQLGVSFFQRRADEFLSNLESLRPSE